TTLSPGVSTKRHPSQMLAHWFCGADVFEMGAVTLSVACWSVLSVMRVFLRSEKMKRNIRLIAHDPAVMARTDVKAVDRFHDIRSTTLHCTRRLSGYHHPDMLHLAKGSPSNWCNVLRPFPAGFIYLAANCHSADLDEFEPSFFKSANLIRLLE